MNTINSSSRPSLSVNLWPGCLFERLLHKLNWNSHTHLIFRIVIRIYNISKIIFSDRHDIPLKSILRNGEISLVCIQTKPWSFFEHIPIQHPKNFCSNFTHKPSQISKIFLLNYYPPPPKKNIIVSQQMEGFINCRLYETKPKCIKKKHDRKYIF